MKTRILVPLDGSPLAERALPCAQMLGRELPAELVLFRAVFLPVDMRAMLAGRHTDALAKRFDSEARAYLTRQAAELRDAGLKVSQVIGHGPAAEAIVDTAANPDIQYIVMATHGHGGAHQWARGSVAERVLQCASVPVLMTCALEEKQEPMCCRNILVPLDGSVTAEQALPPAVSIAKATGAEIALFRVSIVFTSGEFTGDFFMPLEGTLQTAGRIARDYPNQVAGRLGAEGIQVSTNVQMGAVAECIVDYAQEHQIDLIAMCTHGQTGLGRWTLGSVSDRVLRSGCLPVLLVHAG